ncbi:MAG TPA: hypothetical protein VHK26_06110 [Methyloceanibacter sp.]|nr:hypothetical protein [Methyloceanibacter sp.]
MFGVRIIVFASTLLGLAALSSLDHAEARQRDSDQGTYTKSSRGSYAWKHARKPTVHHSRSYTHSSAKKTYTQKTSRKSNSRISVNAEAHAGSRSRMGATAKVYAAANPRSAKGVGPRPGAWCGWWMRTQLGGGPELNLARNWARWGRASGPQVGAVVVWSRHVGIITGRSAKGQWIVKSGNDGGRVRERPRSVAGAVFRVA